MEQSIAFGPEVDDRALDREVRKIDKKLDSTGDINPSLQSGGMSGGGGVGGLTDGGGGGGVMEELGGIQEGVAGLGGAVSNKLPGTIAGVSAAAAMPVALAGSAGLGMMKAMHSASARLQTSSSLLGQAWNNVWRPIGDKVDQLFIRDVATELVDETRAFEEALRSGEFLQGAIGLGSALLRGKSGAIINAIFPPTLGASILSYVGSQITSVEWGSLPSKIMGRIPGFQWPDLGFQEWSIPSVNWKSFIPETTFDFNLELPDWLTGVLDTIQGDGGDQETGPPTDIGVPTLPGDGGGGGGGAVVMARGGVVRGRTNAVLGEGGPEAVLPLGRFLRDLGSEIQRAVASGQSGRGQGRQSGDLRRVESKLDDVNRNLKKVERAMSGLELRVNGESLGRASFDGRQNRVADADTTVL